jgi:plastocyanin
MVWKIVMLSIAIVIASFVIAGAIVAVQVLSGDSDFGDVVGQGPGNSGQEPTPVPADAVRIVDNRGSNSYSPNPVEVKVGETVMWVNDDSTIHTATSRDGTFGVGDDAYLRKGQTYSHTFDEAGEYPYYCDVHPAMVGTVIVTEDN